MSKKVERDLNKWNRHSRILRKYKLIKEQEEKSREGKKYYVLTSRGIGVLDRVLLVDQPEVKL